MSNNITITIDDTQAQAKIAALRAAFGDLTPVHAAVGSRIANQIRLCFKMGMDPWGSPWKALKIRQGQPLRDRNRTGLQRIISNPDATGVTIGTAAQPKIAGTHQFGAIINAKPGKRLVFKGPQGAMIFAKRVVIPARPYLPIRQSGTVALPPAWMADITNGIRAYFRKVGV